LATSAIRNLIREDKIAQIVFVDTDLAARWVLQTWISVWNACCKRVLSHANTARLQAKCPCFLIADRYLLPAEQNDSGAVGATPKKGIKMEI